MVVGCRLSVVGCRLLVVGYWLLVVGCWLSVVGCWLYIVGSFGWKPIPSVARVTRDEVSGLKRRKESCLEDSTLPVYSHRIFLYVLVLSSRQLFLLFFISRDFVPGYSRCARYWLPAKATDNQTPTTNHYIFLSIDILFSTIRPQVLSGSLSLIHI